MLVTVEKVWEHVLGLLQKELKGPSFQTWIKPSKLIEIKDDTAIVAVKNEFNKNFLLQNHLEKISQAIEKCIKRKIKVEITVKEDLDLGEFISSIATLKAQKPEHSALSTQHSAPSSEGYFDHTFRFKSNLNPSYSFETFVVGPSNQFCHAACLAVAESLSQGYNPLFIYGGVGLGKTHLAHAIANYMLDQNKNLTVAYTSSESFTNELISSIRKDSMSKFREKFRHVDLLMIDDIQFLAGKEATQEEFFHTFNTLKENGKQLVITADRPPSYLASITDRLKNRFEGGLIADIQAPDLETRIAILMLKALQHGINLSQDVAEYIANVYPQNIRELEGALKRIHAYFSFTQEDINIRNVKRLFGANTNLKPSLSPELVLKSIATFYNITFEELIGTKRSSHLTLPRHVAVYFLHDFYNLSFPRIGELMSNRTHSSAIYSYEQVKKKLASSPSFAEEVTSLKNLLERKSC